MQIIYKETSINYVYYDNKSNNNLIFLHGWGQNIEMMMPIAKPFIKNSNVLILDLPGFGLSDEPKEIWSIDDYTDMVDYIANKMKMKNPIIIGHSFGGKIALEYGIKYNPKKLVLLACTYKAAKKKDNVQTKLLKTIKKVPGLNKLESYAKKHLGSTDYRNASEQMRKILVKHLNLDLTSEVNKIKCPTLLIWGTQDMAVAYDEAIELEKLIKNCGLVTYEGCSHYAYLERLNQTINVLNNFVGEDKK